MMNDRDLQHSDITVIERTGYPVLPVHNEPIVCSRCDEPIEVGKHYGECDGTIVCCECVNAEFAELTAQEKFDKLGFDVKYNG